MQQLLNLTCNSFASPFLLRCGHVGFIPLLIRQSKKWTYGEFPRLLPEQKRAGESFVGSRADRVQCHGHSSVKRRRVCSQDHTVAETAKADKHRGNRGRRRLPLSVIEVYTPVMPCIHWLEMQDGLHRYGSYLREYYYHWLRSNSSERFFQWLDYGAGRVINASGRRKVVCRSQLDNSRVQYCSLQERQQYVITVRNGKLVWANGVSSCKGGKHEAVHTTDSSEKWIFVIDLHGKCYLNKKQKGRFHHSSFMSGAPVQMAGRMRVADGKIVEIGEYSGHYRCSVSQLKRSVQAFFGEAMESDDGIVS